MRYLFLLLIPFILGFIFIPRMVDKSIESDKRLVYNACLYGYNTALQTTEEKAGQVCKNLVKLVYGEKNEKSTSHN